MSNNYSRDPDDLHGDEKIAVLEIAVRRNGSMSVIGCINDLSYALQMLEEAKAAVRRHHAREVKLIIPPSYTDIKVPA